MEPSLEEIERAYSLWQFRHFREIDLAITPFLTSPAFGQNGDVSWLRKARQSLLLSTSRVGERMGISRAAYAKLEENESMGAITLTTLAQTAAAMDCELVYALRPRSRRAFSREIWDKLLPDAARHYQVRSRKGVFKVRTLIGLATRFLEDPAYRRKQGWTQRPCLK